MVFGFWCFFSTNMDDNSELFKIPMHHKLLPTVETNPPSSLLIECRLNACLGEHHVW